MIPKSTVEEEKANACLTSLVNTVSSINETAAEEILKSYMTLNALIDDLEAI
jgi:hypothetical protein